MVLIQTFNRKALSISSRFFILTIVFYPCLTSVFSSCIYNAIYFIIISFLLQNFLSLSKINSLFLSIRRAIINILFLFSTFESQSWKISVNSTFEHKYITYILQIFASSNIVAYIFLESKDELCSLHKLIFIFLSFFFALVIGLLQFTT